MPVEMAAKGEKNIEKIFSKTQNPHSARALPFYILDMLHPAATGGRYHTIPQIQREILTEKKVWYDYHTIQHCLLYLHQFSTTYMLRLSPQTNHHGASIGTGYMLVFKKLSNENV